MRETYHFVMNPGQGFNQARRSRLTELPKVELHRHLECSMRLETLVELAKDLKMDLPVDPEAIKKEFLVTTPMVDLDSVLKKFLRTQAVLDSEEILSRITYEVIEDAANEGIKILELRFAPTFITQGHPHLDFDKVLKGIRKGFEFAHELPIAVGFISIIQRILPVETAESVTDFTIANKDFFVGLDLADNEDGFDPVIFQNCFQRAKKNGLHITVHAGEAPIKNASLNVKNAIEVLGAERIGHGVQIYKDPFVMSLLRNKGIPLELCVTSNWLTQAVSDLTTHPIRQLMKEVPVTINSDDPGIFGIDLVNEYELLESSYQFTTEEFQRCNDIAAQASFIPLMKKQKHWPRAIHTLR